MISVSTIQRNPWSMWDDLAVMQEDFNRLLDHPGWPVRRRTSLPPLRVWASEAEAVVDVDLPGVDPKQVEITVKGDVLMLSGTVPTEAKADTTAYQLQERYAGEFQRTVTLPFRAQAESVKANYKNGILRIRVPRVPGETPRRIAIEAA